jgi:L-fuculose-phosphate aldolase
VKTDILAVKKELARYARKAAEDKLTVATSGNISAKRGNRIYIKVMGASFEKARPSDFIGIDIGYPSLKRLKIRPSFEYRSHIACYKKRPEIKAVLHTHPLIATTLYSAGIKSEPVTIEFALYIGKRITAINFIQPGTKKLADTVGRAVTGHDAVVIKKHGLVTVGQSLQEAYLRALVIEREARAQFICRLFKKSPPFLRKNEGLMYG